MSEDRREAHASRSLQEQFGAIDIYLFDQLLRGQLHVGQRVLDAGCGYGRNLLYLLHAGFEVYAVDGNPEAVSAVRALAADLRPELDRGHFQTGMLEALPFQEGFFDAVLCNAVLHFAADEEHFGAMLRELWRVLGPGGLLFCRLGTRIGLSFTPEGNGRYMTGDGAVWFLPDAAELKRWTAALGGELVDPLKTTLVEDRRAMTTWVLRKGYA